MNLCSFLGKPDVTHVVTVSVEAGEPVARYAVTYLAGSPCLVSRLNPRTRTLARFVEGASRYGQRQAKGNGSRGLASSVHCAKTR